MYLLDTNIIIYTIKNKYDAIKRKIEFAGVNNVCVSALTVAEMEHGAAKSMNPERARVIMYEFLTPFEIIDFDTRAAECYGRIRANLEKNGNIIGPIDLLIGATALSRKYTVVTNNVKEFNRIDGLMIENWVIQENQ